VVVAGVSVAKPAKEHALVKLCVEGEPLGSVRWCERQALRSGMRSLTAYLLMCKDWRQ
jgi:hypothetical protein